MTDLSLTPTDDLLRELHSRFDASLFVGEQQRGDGDVHRQFSYSGSLALSLGLAMLAARWLEAAEFTRLSEPGESGEE